MYFLLLLVWICFFFIFFLFSSVENLSWSLVSSLFLQAHIYVLLSLLWCLLVYKQSFIWKKVENLDPEEWSQLAEYIPSLQEFKSFVVDFFSSYIYYIAGLLFYIAIYIIIGSFYVNIDAAYIFLVFNIVVIILYFLPYDNTLWKDLIVVNLILISLYYIFDHILYLSSFSGVPSLIDAINIITIFFLFSLLLFNKQYNWYKNIVEQYLLLFLSLELAVLHNLVFNLELYSVWIVTGIVWWSLLIFTDEIKKLLSISRYASRTWGLILCAMSVWVYTLWVLLIGQIYVSYSFGILIIALLMMMFHQRFCSYFSLSVWSLWITIIWYIFYDIIFKSSYWNSYLFILYFFMSVLFLYIFKLLKTSFSFDKYFFRIVSVLVNVLWVITFLFFYKISILSTWILLLWESVYLFFLYYSLREKIK